MFLISKNYWSVSKTKDKGFGIFAKKKIRAGTVIGDYLGKVIETRLYDLDKDKKGLYLMYLTDETSIYPNLKKPDIHLLNHSCSPNCWMHIYRGHTLFFAIKDILPGVELTISYLLKPKDDCERCTHICKCGHKFCRGTMHPSAANYKKWRRFQNNQKKNKPEKIVVGRNLPKLNIYPKTIPLDPIYASISANN